MKKMPLVWTPQKVLQKQQGTLQEERVYNCEGVPLSLQQKPHKTGDKKICEEYTIEATIQKKMRLYKCDTYIAKETLGYRGGQEEKKTHKK